MDEGFNKAINPKPTAQQPCAVWPKTQAYANFGWQDSISNMLKDRVLKSIEAQWQCFADRPWYEQFECKPDERISVNTERKQ